MQEIRLGILESDKDRTPVLRLWLVELRIRYGRLGRPIASLSFQHRDVLAAFFIHLNQLGTFGMEALQEPQVDAIQGNLEVGDPLTGTVVPAVTQPNGFTYDLQELAFFSWFFGGPSIGINGWYSDNGTFTTDAGTPCLLQ